MSKKKAREVCKNLYRTIINMKPTPMVHNNEMFQDLPVRPSKEIFKGLYNKLVKKYGFRRRQL
jgi:TRAP-type C4-dicarboxylate transport system substrate-binding protein